MASEAKVPPEIKKNVRAVLLSMIGGVSLEKFQSDYRTLVAGQPLDPPRLGFCSLLDFLKAMPDVVRIENGDDLEKCRLFGVVDPDCYASSTIIKASNIDAAPPRVRKKTKSKFGKKKFQRFPYHVGDETDTGYQSDGNLLTKTRNQQQNSKKARNKWPNKKGRRDDDPKPAYCDENNGYLSDGYIQSHQKHHPKNRVQAQNKKFLTNIQEDRKIECDSIDDHLKDTAKENELVPNMKGYYAVCFVKPGPITREEVQDAFSSVGEIKEVSFTNKFVFVRYGTKNETLRCLKELGKKYDLRVPREKMEPRFVHKDRSESVEDKVKKRAIANADDSILKMGGDKKVYELYVGNIPEDANRAEIEKIFEEYKSGKIRYVEKDNRRYCFVPCESDEVVQKAIKAHNHHRINGQKICVQASHSGIGDTIATSPVSAPPLPKASFLTNLLNNHTQSKEPEKPLEMTNGRKVQNRMSGALSVEIPGLLPTPPIMPARMAPPMLLSPVNAMGMMAQQQQYPPYRHGVKPGLLPHPVMLSPRMPAAMLPPHNVPTSTRQRTYDVFVGGFPHGTSKYELMQAFEAFSPVGCRIINNIDVLRRTIAFVKFGTAECAEKVLRTMDGCLFGGFPIAVKPPRPNKHTGKGEPSHPPTGRPEPSPTPPSEGGDACDRKSPLDTAHQAAPPSVSDLDSLLGADDLESEIGFGDDLPEMMDEDFLLMVYKSCSDEVPLVGSKLSSAAEVVVTHVEDSSYFWAHVKDRIPDLIKLKMLMETIQKPDMLTALPRHAHRCAAQYEGEWYRAWIVDKLPDGEAEVFFIDYGNTEVCAMSDLRGLPQSCWKLRPQAVPFVFSRDHQDTKSAEGLVYQLIRVQPNQKSQNCVIPVRLIEVVKQ